MSLTVAQANLIQILTMNVLLQTYITNSLVHSEISIF